MALDEQGVIATEPSEVTLLARGRATPEASLNKKSADYLNRRHTDLTKLTLASADISNTYDRMTLAKLWGPGHSVAVDGT